MSRILVDATGVVRGGVLRVLSETLSHWPSGDEAHVVADPEVCEAVQHLNIVPHPVGDGGRRSVLTGALVELPRLRRSLQPDAMVSFSPSLPGALVSPDVTVVHDLFFRLWPAAISRSVLAYRTISYRRALTSSRHLLCVSERTRHDLEGWLPREAAKSSVWPPAVADAFRVPALDRASRVAVVVPAQNEFKGSGLVVDALDREGDPPVVLLAGSEERAAELTARYSARTRRPTVLARLSDGEMIATIASARALVMASHIEGAGLPVLEALALQTPVVVSPDPALVETGHGFAAAMHTWSVDAVRQALDVALALPAEHWVRAAGVATARTWATAARELRDVALSGSARR